MGTDVGNGTQSSGGSRLHYDQQYDTAYEFNKLLTKTCDFEKDNNESLTERDLIMIYKKRDPEAQITSNHNRMEPRKSNQYVETVIYNDDHGSEVSDISEVYTNDLIQNLIRLNEETLDIMDTPSSYENILCEKFGETQLQCSDLLINYDRNFNLKDHIHEQLRSLNTWCDLITEQKLNVFPPSVLDFLCCEDLEDNYSFYIDNVITYVRHTIDQLKRISSGEYLTDRAKEKWREVDCVQIENIENVNDSNLAKLSSVPLYVQRKFVGFQSPLDNFLVLSEIEVTLFSNLLKKQIVFEIPKNLFNLYNNGDMKKIIKYKKNKKNERSNKLADYSNTTLNIKLNRILSSFVLNGLTSLGIVNTETSTDKAGLYDLVSISININNNKDKEDENEVTEIHDMNENYGNDQHFDKIAPTAENVNTNTEHFNAKEDNISLGTDKSHGKTKNLVQSSENVHENTLIDYSDIHNISCAKDVTHEGKESYNYQELLNYVMPGELRLAMKNLKIDSSLTEEIGEEIMQTTATTLPKRKSGRPVRIKSPYENKTIMIDEKKRKRLLEIRERREKKKLAMAATERNKVSKYKHNRVAPMPQASNSVTKLSITNKSFYNSVFGERTPIKNKEGKKEVSLDLTPINNDIQSSDTSEINGCSINKKLINRSYYIDNRVTENLKQKEERNDRIHSATMSIITDDFDGSVDNSSEIMQSDVLLTLQESSISLDNSHTSNHNISKEVKIEYLDLDDSKINKVPVNITSQQIKSKNQASSFEFRKNIENLYNLINKDITVAENQWTTNYTSVTGVMGSCSVQNSEQISSNPSSFSICNLINSEGTELQQSNQKNSVSPTVHTPKVIINTKSQSSKLEDKCKKDRKNINEDRINIKENPLKAISQILHKFENVQKFKNKTQGNANKSDNFIVNKPNCTNMLKNKKYIPDNMPVDKKTLIPLDKRKKNKLDSPKLLPALGDERRLNFAKKKIDDIIDEAKEARGEAVRGPRHNTRISTLAQPKKIYVQAHSEEYQSKYGRNLMADRLQRLAAGLTTQNNDKSSSYISYLRTKRHRSPETVKEIQNSSQYLGKAAGNYAQSADKKIIRNASGVEPTCKQNAETSSSLKRMEAVESYVKSHFGRGSPPPETKVMHMSPAPLVPQDLELGSLSSTVTGEESSVLGGKLHNIIYSMLNTNEESYEEKFPDIQKKHVTFQKKLKILEPSTESENSCDVFADKTILTAVSENIDEASNISTTVKVSSEFTESRKKSLDTISELKLLETALFRRISMGSFPKNLRLKNLTLTPKNSIQRIMIMQSEDTNNTSFLKSTSLNHGSVSEKNIFNTKNHFPILSEYCFSLGLRTLPITVTTVGYMFPRYQHTDKYLQGNKFDVSQISKKSIQCCEEKPDRFENRSAQVDVSNINMHEGFNYNVKSQTEIIKEVASSKALAVVKDISEVNMKTSAIQSEKLTAICDTRKVSDCRSDHQIETTDAIEYSTSLDLLVSLLNEIQKITKCQTNTLSIAGSSQHERKEINTIYDKTNLSCVTSEHDVQKPDSTPSFYSFYKSKNFFKKDTDLKMPSVAHKEISVKIPERVFVNTFTQITSELLPLYATHSTTVTESLRELWSRPSIQSMYSSYQHKMDSLCNRRVIELPYEPVRTISMEIKGNKIGGKAKNESNLSDRLAIMSNSHASFNKLRTFKLDHNDNDFDPIMKMKRDVLVTVYSILVFTVFAALSFPNLVLYHV